ncbi:MAG: biopolymer transporter ExbD [Bdellovibrionales bacterium]|nr:biopolymer transporter ExbD [Bdellovibrionales bacterium]
MSIGPIEGGQDVDLNLAPIIDAFTVLIAFMLVSASFLAIGVLDAGVAAGGKAGDKAKPPAVTIRVHLEEGRNIRLETTGQLSLKLTLKPEGEAWNQGGLQAELAKLKSRFPDVKAAILSADDSVAYEDVVSQMGALRKTYPGVLLGGF